uniref:DH domain-containing protein n=1 Tax=Romanomermis culicivorax TaxID=13658 RepID=A0A915L4A0_ROMCU
MYGYFDERISKTVWYLGGKASGPPLTSIHFLFDKSGKPKVDGNFVPIGTLIAFARSPGLYSNHHPENDSVEDPVISSLQRLTSRQVSQIDSLIEIETKFCSDLDFLRIHYYEPLKSSSLISRQALRFVFPACLFQILSFHSNILKNVRSVFILKELEQIKQILAIYSDAFSPNSDLGRLHMTYEISAVTTFAKIYFYDESDCVTFLNFYQEHLKSVKKLESTVELRLQFLLDMLRRPWQVFGRYRLIFERMWDDFSTNDRERCDFLLDFFERMENIFRQENREQNFRDPITRNIVDQWEFGYRENWSLESFSTERKNTQRYQSMIALLPQASNESNDQIQMDHSPSTPFNERHECPIGNKKEKSKSRLYKKNDHRENSIINFKRSSASSIVAFFKKGRGSTAVGSHVEILSKIYFATSDVHMLIKIVSCERARHKPYIQIPEI